MDKVILTTGGTGGHIFPALAVAEEIKRRYPNARILFIGSQYGPEAMHCAKKGIDFKGLPVRGIMGRGLNAIPGVLKFSAAIFKAAKLIRKFKPQVIAGFGGYASFAPMLAGIISRIPSLIHEQNAIAGASNKILAKFVKTICVSIPDTRGFSRKCVFTGNPVRKAIVSDKSCASKQCGHNLFILGGSQGAHGLNMYVVKILGLLKQNNINIVHQTGKNDYGMVKNCYKAIGYDENCVMPFIDDIDEIYKWANLIMCRSGASTIAEICATGLPAILVPFPAAIHDHQTINAQALANANAAILIQERDLESENTGDKIVNLLNTPETLNQMAINSRKLAKIDAASLIVNEIETLSLTRQ